MKFCPGCGKSAEGYNFCPNCGHDLSDNEIVPQAEATGSLQELDFGNSDAFNWEVMGSFSSARVVEQAVQREQDALAAFEWEKHQNGKYVILALKDKTEMSVVVPAGVEAIGPSAFEGSEVLQVELPEGLLKIGDRAFANCVELDTITFPRSLRVIGREAFAGCIYLDVEIPVNVRIGADVLKGTLWDQRRIAEENRRAEEERKLREEEERKRKEEEERKHEEKAQEEATRIDTLIGKLECTERSMAWCEEVDQLAAQVDRLSARAAGKAQKLYVLNAMREECALLRENFTIQGNTLREYKGTGENVTIPIGVTSIGERAFYCCNSLTDIQVNSNNRNYRNDRYGVLFDHNGSTLIAAPGTLSNVYEIPDSVTSIGAGAFSFCRGLTSITIPDSVTTIGMAAFVACSGLTGITIPASVSSIGVYAFDSCESLTTVYLDRHSPLGENDIAHRFPQKCRFQRV